MTFDTRGHTMMGVVARAGREALARAGAPTPSAATAATAPTSCCRSSQRMHAVAPDAIARREVERRHARARRHAGRLPRRPGDDGRVRASQMREAGARIVGACCGSTPDHLRAMHDALIPAPPT